MLYGFHPLLIRRKLESSHASLVTLTLLITVFVVVVVVVFAVVTRSRRMVRGRRGRRRRRRIGRTVPVGSASTLSPGNNLHKPATLPVASGSRA
jgi:threonine/homoserine/homoserine lactone efflux protein